jgi:hypothetical protein
MQLCVRRRHLLAFLGAPDAFFGAFLAVFNVVLPAFFAADATRFRAKAASLTRELRVGAHEQGSGAAQRGAIAIQFDATGHHFNVVFAQAFTRAVGAFVGAMVTSFNAFKVFFVWHKFSPFRLFKRIVEIRPSHALGEILHRGPRPRRS